jgi:hypothetical protein
MDGTYDRKEMHIGFWSESLKNRDQFKDLCTDQRATFKMDLKERE